jgi:hypothetical protein
MALIEKTLKKYLEYVANGTSDNNLALCYRKLLNRLAQPDIADNENLQAVVGFDKDDNPVFWDMTSGNLLASAGTGQDTDKVGMNLPILSMVLRFPKEKFCFYNIAFDINCWFPSMDEHCIGSNNFYHNEYYLQENKCTFDDLINSIYDTYQKRKQLTKEELKKLPTILVSTVYLGWFSNLDKISSRLKEMFEDGKNYKIVFYVASYSYVSSNIQTDESKSYIIEEHIKERLNCFPNRLIGKVSKEVSELLLGDDRANRLDLDNSISDFMIFYDGKIETIVKGYCREITRVLCSIV